MGQLTGPRHSERENRALELAVAAGNRAGVPVAEAAILRVGTSVLVELPAAHAVARIEDDARCGWRQWHAARAFDVCGAPTLRLLDRELPPHEHGEHLVTLWQRVQRVAEPTMAQLGQAVRQVHDCTREHVDDDVVPLDPCGLIRGQLTAATHWSESDRTALLQQLEELAAEWPELVRGDPLGTVIAHGDVHGDNALVGPEGLVLLDLEHSGTGPASWDLVVLAVAVRQYRFPPADYRAFTDGYGARADEWSGFESMCRLYELMVTAWAIACSPYSTRLAEEACVRADTLLGRQARVWTLL